MAIPTVQITGAVVAPDGTPLVTGTIVAELSQPGSVLDGATSDRVVGKIVATITNGAIGSDFDLVPNDLIAPAGTYYKVTISGNTADSTHYRSSTPEKWQVASGTATIDVGAVLRIGGTPTLVYGPDPATLAARDAALAAQAATEAALSTKVTAAGGDASATVVTPTGASTPRTMAARFADVVNVKDYGAVCDGVTDDTAAVQAMIAALGQTQAATVVVPGPCYVTANITIPAIQPVRMDGAGGFEGTGLVTYRPHGVYGQGVPTRRRLTGTIAQSFASGSFSVASSANATTPTATADARGATKVTCASATANQFTGVKATGTWDFSASTEFMLEVGCDTPQQLTSFAVFFCCDSGTTFTNYAEITLQASNWPKMARFGIPILKSGVTSHGTMNWAAVQRIEIRFYKTASSAVAGPIEAFVYAMWSNITARPKVILTLDDGAPSIYTAAFPITQAAGIRGTAYVNGNTVGNGSQVTLAQLREMYRAGWDIGCHTWNHTQLSKWATSITRSGTVATATFPSTEPHGLLAGGTFTLAGSDEAGWNGTFTVDTVPNAYTLTFTVSSALEAQCYGKPYISSAVTEGAIREALRRNQEWLKSNGFHRSWMHHAYPAGYYDPSVITLLQGYGYSTARATHNWPIGSTQEATPTQAGLFYPFEIPSLSIGYPTTAATILGLVDLAIARGNSLFLNGHSVVTSPASEYSTSTAEFTALVSGLASRRDAGTLDVITVSEWFDRL